MSSSAMPLLYYEAALQGQGQRLDQVQPQTTQVSADVSLHEKASILAPSPRPWPLRLTPSGCACMSTTHCKMVHWWLSSFRVRGLLMLHPTSCHAV